MPIPDGRPMTGRPLALDLLNTTFRKRGELIDWLDGDAAVEVFASSYDHRIPAGEIEIARAALVEARDLVRRVLESAPADSQTFTAKLASEVNAKLESARVMVVADEEGPGLLLTGDTTSNALAVEAIIDAVRLVREHPGRFRSCRDDACVLWFLDTSKGGRRQWCSMDRCGNRAKARRHYERSTQPANDQS